MTHVIIPIQELEEKVAHYQRTLIKYDEIYGFLGESERGHQFYSAQAYLDLYEHLLATAKQISLDEKDIDKLAYIVYPNDGNSFNTLKEEGYKQALMDLQ